MGMGWVGKHGLGMDGMGMDGMGVGGNGDGIGGCDGGWWERGWAGWVDGARGRVSIVSAQRAITSHFPYLLFLRLNVFPLRPLNNVCVHRQQPHF